MFKRHTKEISTEDIRLRQAPDIIDLACVIFAILTALLVLATIVMAIAGHYLNDSNNVLSLGSVSPLSSKPLFMVESTTEARYLRGAIGIDYGTKGWQLVETDGNELEISPSRDRLPLHPTGLAQKYSEYEASVLNRASLIDTPRYLDMPDGISDRVRQLAQRITQRFDTPFERARAIEVFLKTDYTYNLDFVPAPNGWEPNDWFLFESKEGICGNFSSAFVILARASGIPSRMGAGYYVRAGDGEQLVYEDEAHAWAEVGFERLGWLVFDAT